MRKKHEALLEILRQSSQPMSSTQLAARLQVTPRSIKNYVAALNRSVPGLIQSSSKGYVLNPHKNIRPSVNGIPQTFEERSSYLIRRFFIQHAETIDMY